MKPPFKLIDSAMSTDTVECLRELLQQAESGQVIGVAYAVMLKRRGYVCSAAGEAARSPTYARGMLCALSDKLGEMVR